MPSLMELGANRYNTEKTINQGVWSQLTMQTEKNIFKQFPLWSYANELSPLQVVYFQALRLSWFVGGVFGYNSEKGLSKHHPYQVWYKLAKCFQRRTLKCEKFTPRWFDMRCFDVMRPHLHVYTKHIKKVQLQFAEEYFNCIVH